jgi:hypothetical protein
MIWKTKGRKCTIYDDNKMLKHLGNQFKHVSATSVTHGEFDRLTCMHTQLNLVTNA